MQNHPQLPPSRHFSIEPISKGVYAAIHKAGGWAVGNAGIIDLGDITLVFDSFMTPTAAQDLRRDAEALTGRIAALVINSHYHNDHIWGNQAFLREAKIVSTVETHELIPTAGKEEFDWFAENSPAQLSTMEANLAQETDPGRRQQIAEWMSYYQALVETMPDLEVCLPNVTFRERLVVHGSARTAEVITYGGGHTGSDAFLWLPEEKTAFLGDLLFVNHHSYLYDGDLSALREILKRNDGLNPETLVPGHGPLGSPADVESNLDYIDSLLELATPVREDEAGEATIDSIPVPQRFSSWGFTNFFRLNLEFLSRLTDSEKGG